MKKKGGKNPLKKMKGKASRTSDRDDPILMSTVDVAAITTEVEDGELVVETCPGDANFLEEEDDDEVDGKKTEKVCQQVCSRNH